MESGQYVFLEGDICVQNCLDGYYENTTLSECMACADGCSTCDGPTLEDCFTCDDNGTHDYYKVLELTKCDT